MPVSSSKRLLYLLMPSGHFHHSKSCSTQSQASKTRDVSKHARQCKVLQETLGRTSMSCSAAIKHMYL